MSKTATEEPTRIAYCECGVTFRGATERQLFDAAQAHLAHHHPELMGAFELEVLSQMAEELPGVASA